MIRTSIAPLALGAALAAALVASPLAAQVRAPATAGVEKPTPGEPCCGVQSVNRRTGTVTAVVKATGERFTFRAGRAFLRSLRVGEALAFTPAAESTACAATSAPSRSCGTNVPRDADTRPKECVTTNSAGQTIKVPCPPGTLKR